MIKNNDRVDESIIKTYQEIDGLKVIEDYLLFKGTDYISDDLEVKLKHLEDMALISYGLKVTATNRLYVGLYLEKFYKRNQIINGSIVFIPKSIFDKVKEIHERFKKDRP
jgi:hypothetical protein